LRRLAQEHSDEHRDRETEATGDDEGLAPADEAREQSSDQEAQQYSHVRTGREDCHCPGAPLQRIQIGDHRVRRRTRSGLADSDADPRRQQLPVIHGKATQHGHRAEHEQ